MKGFFFFFFKFLFLSVLSKMTKLKGPKENKMTTGFKVNLYGLFLCSKAAWDLLSDISVLLTGSQCSLL